MRQTMVATVGSEKLEFARTPIKATWQQCSPSRTWCSWLSALRSWASLGMTPRTFQLQKNCQHTVCKRMSTLSVWLFAEVAWSNFQPRPKKGRLTGFCSTKWQREKGSLSCVPGEVEALQNGPVFSYNFFTSINAHVWSFLDEHFNLVVETKV